MWEKVRSFKDHGVGLYHVGPKNTNRCFFSENETKLRPEVAIKPESSTGPGSGKNQLSGDNVANHRHLGGFSASFGQTKYFAHQSALGVAFCGSDLVS